MTAPLVATVDAHCRGYVTAHNTSYSMDGLVMLSSGGEFCYAYDKISDLANSSYWRQCAPSKIYGCCPEHLTEDFFWRNPQEYPRHPPTLLVQSEIDYDADWEAARFCACAAPLLLSFCDTNVSPSTLRKI